MTRKLQFFELNSGVGLMNRILEAQKCDCAIQLKERENYNYSAQKCAWVLPSPHLSIFLSKNKAWPSWHWFRSVYRQRRTLMHSFCTLDGILWHFRSGSRKRRRFLIQINISCRYRWIRCLTVRRRQCNLIIKRDGNSFKNNANLICLMCVLQNLFKSIVFDFNKCVKGWMYLNWQRYNHRQIVLICLMLFHHILTFITLKTTAIHTNYAWFRINCFYCFLWYRLTWHSSHCTIAGCLVTSWLSSFTIVPP